MGILLSISRRLLLVGIAVFTGIYLNYPAPKMSDNLRLWVQSGQFFLRGSALKVFYKGPDTKY